LDEAGIVRDLRTIWDQALRPTVVDLKGDARFYGTPRGRTHGFVQLFAKGEMREEGWASFRAPTRDNPYIPLSEIELAKRELPPAVFAQEFEGIPADDAANPFGMTAIQACVGELSTQEPVVWGWDFARAQDWTVGIGLDLSGKVCRVERWQLVPWGETKRRCVQMTGKGIPAVGDSTGIGDAVVEDIQRAGIGMEGYHFSPKSKQQLMERLAGAIQGGQLTFPDGPIRMELDTFEYEFSASGVKYSAPTGLHDDCVMALSLALYGYDTYGFGAKYTRVEQQKRRDAEPEPDRRKTLGFDFVGQRPKIRRSADDEVAEMFRRRQPNPLAGRYSLPRK